MSVLSGDAFMAIVRVQSAMACVGVVASVGLNTMNRHRCMFVDAIVRYVGLGIDTAGLTTWDV